MQRRWSSTTLVLVALVASFAGAAVSAQEKEESTASGDLDVLTAVVLAMNDGRAEDAASVLAAHGFGKQWELEALALRGMLAEQANDTPTVYRVYEEALEKYPGDALIHLRLGVQSVRSCGGTQARKHLYKSFLASPSAEAAYYLGEHFAYQRKTEYARKYLIHAVIRDEQGGKWHVKALALLAKLNE